MSEKKQALMQQLNRETSKIGWEELQRHFAGGNVVYVDPTLDLIDTAAEIALDNKQALQQWMQEQRVMRATDAHAQNWHEQNAVVWAVVVAPLVLVQPVREV